MHQRVIDVFRFVKKKKLSLDANLISDLGLDSLNMVEVNIAAEEDFHLEIPILLLRASEFPMTLCILCMALMATQLVMRGV